MSKAEQSEKWQPGDFSRRSYTIEGEDLEKARTIKVQVTVDGRPIVNAQLREPGILAVISRPDAQGITIEMVEPGGARFTDYVLPNGNNQTLPAAPWQLSLLLDEPETKRE